MEPTRREIIIKAEPESALTQICGISLLERLLRILQRLDVTDVTVFSTSTEPIRAHLAEPSWARAALAVKIVDAGCAGSEGTRLAALLDASDTASSLIVLLYAGVYLDPRLIDALLCCETTTVLIDSAAPPIGNAERIAAGYLCGAAAIQKRWLLKCDRDQAVEHQLAEAAAKQQISQIDVAQQPTYLPNLRRDLRPLWFPAPSTADLTTAEHLILDAAQNGTLDLPAIVHGPIETAIIARLCKTPVTPNQITLATAGVSAAVALLFASGQLVPATVLALVVGVLDGLDGKQARVKVETTALGTGEHALDYVLELSWWAALAYHFDRTAQVPHAFALFALLVGSDLVDRAAKSVAKKHTSRNLDDVAPIDRFVRLIGGRRNIYIWILASGLLLRSADKAFVALCWWGAATAAVHVLRSGWISWERRRLRREGIAH